MTNGLDPICKQKLSLSLFQYFKNFNINTQAPDVINISCNEKKNISPTYSTYRTCICRGYIYIFVTRTINVRCLCINII